MPLKHVLKLQVFLIDLFVLGIDLSLVFIFGVQKSQLQMKRPKLCAYW